MKLQKLEPSKHKEGCWLACLEDGSLVRIGEGDVVSLSLYTGREMDEKETAALYAAAEQRKLNERAVSLLSARPMSRKELVDKLSTPSRTRKPGRDTEMENGEALRAAAEKEADRLSELGLLDDREYAHTVVRHYAAKGFGARKIKDELYRRGVPREFWNEALDGLEAEDSTLDRLVRQKLRGAEPTRESLKKASDYLARRGFGWEEIAEALRRYGAEK